MQKGKIVFTGSFWEYFGLSIVLFFLSVITLGLLVPFWIYWSFKYFFTHMEIELYGGGASVVINEKGGNNS